jgi:acyl carrier protein phosphodiesterase
MNFLAHLYLSGTPAEIMVGNFIGDYVKGKNYEKYPEYIRLGILLHRKIDTFTDNNEIAKKTKNRFAPAYHKYAGALTDVIFDHFLAVEWDKYATIPLHDFIYLAYENLLNNFDLLPERVKNFLPFFVISDWLDSYRTINGLTKAFHLMSIKTSLPRETGFAINEIITNYEDIKKEFNIFFPQLIIHIKHDLSGIETFIKS